MFNNFGEGYLLIATGTEKDSASRASFSHTDWLIVALLALAAIVFLAAHVTRPITPMEDASMLLRYSQNFARGHGIVWNVGEKPVEGATDFLFMVAVGCFSRLTKVGVQESAMGILFVSQVATVVLLYAGLRRIYDTPRFLAICFAATMGAGLGYRYINTAFSPPFYALFALLTWLVGMECVVNGVTWKRAIWFGIFAFVTGLVRPDGVFLAGFMLCSTLYGVKGRRLPLLISFGLIFAVCGGVYFGWRLHYFGYAFPNPFYIKRISRVEFSSLKLSARIFVELLLPLLPLAGLGIRSRAAFRQLSIWLITVVPFTAIWMIVSLDNNHFSRFQYVMVPLSLLSLGGVVAVWWNGLKREQPQLVQQLKLPLIGASVLLFGITIFYNMHLYVAPFSNVGGQQLALRLKPYASKNYTMVVTEAGDIPFYSEWRAIDAYGLNDAYIAHHNNGIVSEAYLEKYRPEIIMYRVWAEYRSVKEFEAQSGGDPVPSTDKLTEDDIILNRYAVRHGYILAALWGSTYCDYHKYWVRPDFADSAAIVSAIRDHPYYTQQTGQLSYDFRDAPVPSIPCSVN